MSGLSAAVTMTPVPVVSHEAQQSLENDGQRATVHLPGDGTVLVRSRSGADISAVYPELAELGSVLGRPAVLDGEIVALGREGHSDFERLQSRMGR